MDSSGVATPAWRRETESRIWSMRCLSSVFCYTFNHQSFPNQMTWPHHHGDFISGFRMDYGAKICSKVSIRNAADRLWRYFSGSAVLGFARALELAARVRSASLVTRIGSLSPLGCFEKTKKTLENVRKLKNK